MRREKLGSALETHNASLQQRMCDINVARWTSAKAHSLGIVGIVVDTTHDALVIPEEEYGETSNGIDGYQQRPLLKLARDIVFGDVLHDGGGLRSEWEC